MFFMLMHHVSNYYLLSFLTVAALRALASAALAFFISGERRYHQPASQQ